MRTTTPSVENTCMNTCVVSGEDSSDTSIAVSELHLTVVSPVQDKIVTGSGQTLESQFKVMFMFIFPCWAGKLKPWSIESMCVVFVFYLYYFQC